LQRIGISAMRLSCWLSV